jgi:hypothetical protein
MSAWYRGWRLRRRPSHVRFVVVPSGRTTLFASGLRATHPVVVEVWEACL